MSLITRELDYAILENTDLVDLVRKLQYQIGKIADIRNSEILKKASKIFLRTTRVEVR